MGLRTTEIYCLPVPEARSTSPVITLMARRKAGADLFRRISSFCTFRCFREFRGGVSTQRSPFQCQGPFFPNWDPDLGVALMPSLEL